MPIARRRTPFAEFLRRLFGASAAAVVLALTVFAASPELHAWLHHGDSQGSDDGCAVVQFANGVSVPLGAIAVVPPSAEWREQPRATAQKIFLASPRYLRQPERGPPVLG